LLVPPKDPQAIATAIIQLISYPNQRKEMSEKGYFSYTSGLTLKSALDKYIMTYRSLLNHGL
jgi:glycosyltransferase involved in cell wall biosynthesis